MQLLRENAGYCVCLAIVTSNLLTLLFLLGFICNSKFKGFFFKMVAKEIQLCIQNQLPVALVSSELWEQDLNIRYGGSISVYCSSWMRHKGDQEGGEK